VAKLSLKAGSTSKSIRIFVQDSSQTIIAGLNGLVFNSTGLTAYYIKEGSATVTQIALVTKTVGTWVSGGFAAIDAVNMPGVYELDLPDAAISTGKSTLVYLRGAANMAPVQAEIELTAVDNQDAAGFGLSRLDAAVSSRSVYAGGAVASVTAPVTVGTNNDKTGYTASTISDKTGYALSVAPPTVAAIQSGLPTDATIQADASAALLAAGYTSTRAGYLDTLNGLVAAVWNALTSGFVTAGSVGLKLKNWALGSDGKSLLSTDAQTGAVIPTVTNLTNPASLSAQDEAVMAKFAVMLNGTPAFTAPALALAPTGGSAPTAAAIRTEIDTNSTQLAAIVAKTTNLPASPAAVGSAMTLDLTQGVPTTNTAQTIGDALNAARAQGFGKWAVVGTALNLYAANGTTIVHAFTLDSATAPTSRS
jgi:hypothetical protein